MKFNLLFFVRILMRHLWLLVTIPIILGVLIFTLTKDAPKEFESKGRVFTAFGSGPTIDLNNTKLDFRATNIAYDNLLNLIKSRTTQETVALRLFTQHMMQDSANPQIIGKEKFDALMAEVPEDVKALVVKGDYEQTYQNFREYKESSANNFINHLISLNHPDYSADKILERTNIRRVNMSDFIDISFTSEDPAICRNTLIILCETFIALNAEIKANQSDRVVRYFEDQLSKTTTELNKAERELLEFNRDNKIMNYYEQTKQIAMRRETFELKYQEVHQRYAAAEAVLPELEKQLTTTARRKLNSKEMIDLRNRLSDLNYRISLKTLEMAGDSLVRESAGKELGVMEIQKNHIKKELETKVEELFSMDNDVSGVNTTNILNQYLDALVNYESSKAELNLLDIKRLEFDRLTVQYAPLGATMKKLERKINVEEQEYLSLLHSLGLAKLRQQNVELQSNLKISDMPYLPLEPKPSKQMMLVAVGVIFGFLMVTMTVLVLEFLDGNINTAARAEDRTGLKVSSIFPVIYYGKRKIDYAYIENKAVNAISRNIMLNQFQVKEQSGPVVNLFVSTQSNEGKSFICNHLMQKLDELGYSVMFLTYEKDFDDAVPPRSHRHVYQVSDMLYRISTLDEFGAQGSLGGYQNYDFVLLEIPSIIRNPFPVKLAASMDFTFLVVRANRSWSEADKNALALFNEATTGPEPTVILNGVKILEMETVLGDLPKSRSLLRQWAKRLIQLRFFTKKSIV